MKHVNLVSRSIGDATMLRILCAESAPRVSLGTNGEPHLRREDKCDELFCVDPGKLP